MYYWGKEIVYTARHIVWVVAMHSRCVMYGNMYCTVGQHLSTSDHSKSRHPSTRLSFCASQDRKISVEEQHSPFCIPQELLKAKFIRPCRGF